MFDNILSNAAKYSAGDLTVTLTPDGHRVLDAGAPLWESVQGQIEARLGPDHADSLRAALNIL